MDQIQMTPDVNPESPEYIEQMSALGEAALNAGNTHKDEAPSIPPKPDYVPDKFYNPQTGEVNYEALAKSYQELEKQRSKPQEAPAEAQEAQAPETPENDQDAANKAVEQAGLNMSDLSREYAEQGSLTEQSYETLAKAGIPKETVDAYIAGQQALAEVARQQAFTITDGQDGYQAMISWAKANMDQDEIKAFNTQVASANKGVRETAIRGLWSRFSSESGEGKPLVGGKTSAPSSGAGYQSKAQMVEAMNDSRYKTDPAYRDAVIQKIAASNIF